MYWAVYGTFHVGETVAGPIFYRFTLPPFAPAHCLILRVLNFVVCMCPWQDTLLSCHEAAVPAVVLSAANEGTRAHCFPDRLVPLLNLPLMLYYRALPRFTTGGSVRC